MTATRKRRKGTVFVSKPCSVEPGSWRPRVVRAAWRGSPWRPGQGKPLFNGVFSRSTYTAHEKRVGRVRAKVAAVASFSHRLGILVGRIIVAAPARSASLRVLVLRDSKNVQQQNRPSGRSDSVSPVRRSVLTERQRRQARKRCVERQIKTLKSYERDRL